GQRGRHRGDRLLPGTGGGRHRLHPGHHRPGPRRPQQAIPGCLAGPARLRPGASPGSRRERRRSGAGCAAAGPPVGAAGCRRRRPQLRGRDHPGEARADHHHPQLRGPRPRPGGAHPQWWDKAGAARLRGRARAAARRGAGLHARIRPAIDHPAARRRGVPRRAGGGRDPTGQRRRHAPPGGSALMPRDTSMVLSATTLQTPFAEAYRGLRANINFAAIGVGVRSILVTSGASGEGKSTTVANLAILLAHAGRRVIVVDADFRRPRLHQLFTTNGHLPHPQGVDAFWHRPEEGRPSAGLSGLIAGTATFAEVAAPVEGCDHTGLIAAGVIPSNPSESPAWPPPASATRAGLRRDIPLQAIVVPLLVLSMLPLPLVTIRSAGFGFGTLAAPLFLAIGVALARRRLGTVEIPYVWLFVALLTVAAISVIN